MTVPLFASRVAQEWTGTGNGASITPGVALTAHRAVADALTVGDLFRYGIVHTTAATVEWEEGIGTVEAAGAIGRTTVLNGSAGPGTRVAFSAGIKHVFIAPGAAFYNGLPARLALTVSTTSIPVGTAWEGTLPAGSFLALHQLVTTDHLWIRFYATAADRAADTRTDYADPAPPELLHEAVLFNTTQEELHVPALFMANADSPALAVLYVRITRLDSAGGLIPPNVVLLEDTLIEASETNLSSHSISTPGSTGATTYEYLGGDATEWKVRPSGDPSGAIRGTASTGALVARVNAPVSDNLIRIVSPMYRGSVESSVAAHGLVFLAPDTALGSWSGYDYMRAMITGQPGGLVGTLVLQHVNGPTGGDVTTLDTVPGLDFELSAEHELMVEIDGNDIRVYWDAGLEISETLPANLLGGGTPITNLKDGAHRHLGFYGQNDNVSGRVTHRSLLVEDIAPGAGGAVIACDVTATRLAS